MLIIFLLLLTFGQISTSQIINGHYTDQQCNYQIIDKQEVVSRSFFGVERFGYDPRIDPAPRKVMSTCNFLCIEEADQNCYHRCITSFEVYVQLGLKYDRYNVDIYYELEITDLNNNLIGYKTYIASPMFDQNDYSIGYTYQSMCPTKFDILRDQPGLKLY